MGWWNATVDGGSLQVEDTGIMWGDGPADVMDMALVNIRDLFVATWGRPPTEVELIAGLKFSWSDE